MNVPVATPPAPVPRVAAPPAGAPSVDAPPAGAPPVPAPRVATHPVAAPPAGVPPLDPRVHIPKNLIDELRQEIPSVNAKRGDPNRPPRISSKRHLDPDHVYRAMVAIIEDEDANDRDSMLKIALFVSLYGEYDTVLKTTLLQRYKTGTPDQRNQYHKALDIELRGLIESHIGRAMHPSELTLDELRKVVQTMLNLREKVRPDGEFDKLKARLLALGNRQKPGTFGPTYAPTVHDRALCLLQAFTTATDSDAFTYDVPVAFLQATIDAEHTDQFGKRHVKLGKEVAAAWIKIRPEDASKLADDGTLIIELDRYLYGFRDSPQAFYSLLRDRFQAAGFSCLISDVCVFYKATPTGYCIILAHVDDVWATSKGDPELKKQFEAVLGTFGEVKGKSLDKSENFVGLKVERDRKRGKMWLSQPKHLLDIRTKFPGLNYDGAGFSNPYHGGTDGFTKPAPTTDPLVDARDYLSKLMYVMYAALKTRWDILYACTYLATKSAAPQRLDMLRVDHLLVYAWKTAHYRRRLAPERGNTTIDFYADASHATLPDGYSMGAYVFRMGNSPYFVKVSKLRPLSMSSTDAEYNVLTEAVKLSEWTRNFLSEIGREVLAPTVGYQDNQSTITLANTNTQSHRSKHAFLRYAYVKEQVELGHIKLEYCPTDEMVADVLTKPMSGNLYRRGITSIGMDITAPPRPGV